MPAHCAVSLLITLIGVRNGTIRFFYTLKPSLSFYVIFRHQMMVPLSCCFCKSLNSQPVAIRIARQHLRIAQR